MASTCLDDFVLNFDLNHLTNETTVKTTEQKYEKLRKTTSWLKSRIISTDFAIQKYQSKKDDYEQSLKAHSITREQLKQACINYRDASEKCTALENENKMLLANEEIMKERVVDYENKYDALLSHTNQLQMLVKQLEDEKDAIKIEKELDKCNDKDRNKEIVALQKERDAILNDLISFKDIILGKKKTCKKHVELLKKYVKDIKITKVSNSKTTCTSEESDDDINSYGNISSHTQRKLVGNITDTSSAEQNFIDNYSDGEVSVDTGRGSSRANSHDKFLGSPDYIASLETLLKIPPKDNIKQIDAACSPITVYPSRSVATSPVVFDLSAPLFEDQYNNYMDYDGPDYVNDDIPLSEEINVILEQEKLAAYASPLYIQSYIDTATSPINNHEYINLPEFINNSPEKSLFIDTDKSRNCDNSSIIENQIPRCLCGKSDVTRANYVKKFVNACTSPIPVSVDHHKFIDIGTNTVKLDNTLNLDRDNAFENRKLSKCEKSTCTHPDSNKNLVNACTSPISELYDRCKFVDVAINTDENYCEFYENNDQMVRNNENSTCSKEDINPCKKTTLSSFEQCKKSNKKLRKDPVIKRKLPVVEENLSGCVNTNPVEQLSTQEKVCLESNSSQNLLFESTNDTEVQNILNIMKLRHELISPIPKTPCDSHYLKLLPEMNSKLTKIWTTLANICRAPNQLRNNVLSHLEIDETGEIPETRNCERNFEKPVQGVKAITEVLEEDLIFISNRMNVETSNIHTKNTTPESLNVAFNEDLNLIQSKGSKSDSFTNNLQSGSTSDENHTIPKKDNIEAGQHNTTDHSNLSYISKEEKEIIKSIKVDNNKAISDSEYMDYNSELNVTSENNITDHSSFKNTETCNIKDARTARPNEIYGTKSKKKSKLDKFRKKLLPSCKMKKTSSSIIKTSSKVNNMRPKNTTSSSRLNQKIAYEKAVKALAEYRSKKELQANKEQFTHLKEDAKLENRLSAGEDTTETSVPKMLGTRSRIQRSSRQEEDMIEPKTQEVQKSPIYRKVRKRAADTEVDNLRSSCKRILRSSTISQVANEETALPKVPFDNAAEQLHDNFKNIVCKAQENNVSNRDHSLCGYDSLNDKVEPENSGATIKKINKNVIKKMKPVIELSECLADNANLVSIIPGNVGYLDVNKNYNHNKEFTPEVNCNIEANENLESNLEIKDEVMLVENILKPSTTDHCVEKGNLYNTPTNIQIEIYRCDPIATMKEDCNAVDNVSETTNASVARDDNMSNVSNINNNSSISTEQSLYESHNNLINNKQNIINSLDPQLPDEAKVSMNKSMLQAIPLKNDLVSSKKNIISYSDLDLYTGESNIEDKTPRTPAADNQHRKENILCSALDRYGVISVKYAAKKVSDTVTLTISQKLEECIPNIIATPKAAEQKTGMNDLVDWIQNYKTKQILAGLMRYLKDSTRKNELFNTIINGPAPPMTKSEMILLYVIESLNASMSNGFINRVWNNIEHALFQLNRAPDFGVIESMSHFYAVLCRYFRNKSRLRCFMLDAMYCLQFKAVPLIRQCLDVCPGVLPNAHERMAKTSLVTCLVYLLHFYKCQDKYNRAQDIRNILYRKYQYRFSEWNETMILEIFRKAIMDLRGTHNDKKMLRVALIILCKRHGAKWCQLNIIQNILLPIIEKKDVPERIKQFCVLMLGPLLKPFPADRKAQCEIVINQLLQMLKQNASQEMKEAIYSSLIFMNKHDQERVVQALLLWNPEKVSPEFEDILNDYVMERPLAVWKKLVTKKASQCT